MIKNDVGKTIKDLRIAKGIFQEDLVLKCGFDRTYITYVENAKKNVTIDTLHKITQALDISLSEFFAMEEPTSVDMPRVMQIWNTYRSRAVGYYLTTLGYNVIPNVRWTDEESYEFAFAGLYEGQIVAVGTLGCSKAVMDKSLLINGFIEMIKRIKPRLILIYGSICKELQNVIEKYDVKVKQYDSDISLFFGGNSHVDEE